LISVFSPPRLHLPSKNILSQRFLRKLL